MTTAAAVAAASSPRAANVGVTDALPTDVEFLLADDTSSCCLCEDALVLLLLLRVANGYGRVAMELYIAVSCCAAAVLRWIYAAASCVCPFDVSLLLLSLLLLLTTA